MLIFTRTKAYVYNLIVTGDELDLNISSNNSFTNKGEINFDTLVANMIDGICSTISSRMIITRNLNGIVRRKAKILQKWLKPKNLSNSSDKGLILIFIATSNTTCYFFVNQEITFMPKKMQKLVMDYCVLGNLA